MVWIEGSPIVILNTQNFQNNMINLTNLLKEASEIPFDKLTPIHQKQIQAFSKVLKGKPIVIFEGIHGMIVDIKVSNPLGVYRFDSDELKKLLALKIRWVEADKDTITIGF
jgi:hypothetical protein